MKRRSMIRLARAVAMFLAVAPAILLVQPDRARSFVVGEDVEKPRPEFTRKNDTVTAKLIPRAKSGSVTIDFRVTGGRLAEVRSVDFETAARPEVDVKNFKSALFEIRIEDVPAGGSVRVSILSDFFTRSTAFYVFNPQQQNPWSRDAQGENIDHPDRVQELVVPVTDGGPFDADGAADGRIRLIGGPRDSFWGYALGTLFIRFFGIFIVLGILMAGILFSGRIFQWIEGRRTAPETAGKPAGAPQPVAAAEAAQAAAGEIAAAVAAALHLHAAGRRSAPSPPFKISSPDAWTLSGRSRMMAERPQNVRRVHYRRS